LIHGDQNDNVHETTIAAILTMAVLEKIETFPTKALDGQLLQIGLLAGMMDTDVGDMQTLVERQLKNS
jgi:hypothetical protein